MRLGCIGLIIGAALSWGGGQQLYESWNAGKKSEISFAQFVAEKPSVGWFHIKDAQWRLLDGAVMTSGVSDTVNGDIYTPITGKEADGKPGAEKIKVLLHSSNSDDATQLMALVKETDPVKAEALVAATPALTKERPVEGMIEFGINSDDKANDAIKRSFGDELAEDYIIITDGAEPAGYLIPLLTLLGGLVLLGFTFRGFAKGGDPDPVDE